MDKIKFSTICLDGIDKTGKDTLLRYIFYLSNKKYLCNARGIMTMIAYSKLYHREFKYSLDGQENIMNILLTADEEDWKIRCKCTSEPVIDYKKNIEAFEYAYRLLQKANKPVLRYNTSELTPYQIAKMIVEEMERKNDIR